jgi:hypothetical protein
MRHLQPDLKRGDVGQSVRVAPRVDGRNRICARIRNPLAICGREIEDGQIAMLMSHGRTERELNVNQHRGENRNRFDRREFCKIDIFT